MQTARLTFNGTDLSLVGRPILRIQSTPDPPPPGQATRQNVSLAVTIFLDAQDPATIQARLEYLRETVATGEGILRQECGGGHYLSWLATPAGNSLAEALGGTRNQVELNFTAWEDAPGTAGLLTASFAPAGGGSVTLHAIRDFDSSITTERVSLLSSARALSTTRTNFTARLYQTNAADPLDTRWAALHAARDSYASTLNCRQATLTMGGVARLVRVSSAAPVIDPSAMALDVRIEAFHVDLPGSSTALVDYEESPASEAGSGEKGYSLSGTITAPDEAVAVARLNALIAAKLETGARLHSIKTSSSHARDGDTTGDEWTGTLKFTIDLRTPQDDVTAYTAKVNTTEDQSGLRMTVSGSVRGRVLASVLAKARAIGAAYGSGKQTKSEETVDWFTPLPIPPAPGTPGAVIGVVEFSYEYRGAATCIRGTVEYSEENGLFAERSATFQGSFSAPSESAARTFARKLIPSGKLLRVDREGVAQEVNSAPGSNPTGGDAPIFATLSFSYGWFVEHSATTLQYRDELRCDEASMTQERVISGTARAPNQAAATAAINSLFTALGLGTPSSYTTSSPYESGPATSTSTPTTIWISVDFSRTFRSSIAGTAGNDIIEASLSLSRTGSINRVVIHEIPFARPVVQNGTGYTAGKLTITARCKARLAATARTWVTGKRSLVNSFGTDGVSRFETDEPQESSDVEYAPFSGTDKTLRVFTGRYGWSFIDGTMDSTWQVGLDQ